LEDLFLYQELDVLRKAGAIVPFPKYMEHNLSKRIELRAYQREAFENTLTYFENNNLRKNKQIHLLYHMATGAGKTVMMAGMILYLYAKGYRNFLFFVNQNNIIEKTKENFLNPSSTKYLFSDIIDLYGTQIPIEEVSNFSMTNPDAINICFQSIQNLHLDIFSPKENGLSIEDFEDNKTVLISDEAHHINSMTKKRLSAEETELKNSWEYSINRIFYSNKDNILLEFTATCDLKDSNVNEKYQDKIIFDYPLAKFRMDGYTKDFKNMALEYNQWDRVLVALILSEYRKNLFSDLGQNIKPVILLKSKIIDDSKAFYDTFFIKLEQLEASDILSLNKDNISLAEALNYFSKKDKTYKTLVTALKIGFTEEHSLIMNSKSKDNTVEKQLSVNSLENKYNLYRLIFTVDMLNEGWDVLNLFDIVRLYETRQGSGTAGKVGDYTIKEAQLIGRGARYCPFTDKDKNSEEKYIRKYDYDIDNPYRILETLLYHSKYNSSYISEIQRALRETGLIPDKQIEIEYKLKESFKETDFFKYGILFSNKKIEKDRTSVSEMDAKTRNLSMTYRASTGDGYVVGLLDNSREKIGSTQSIVQKTYLNDIPYNILQAAIAHFDILKFNILKNYYPYLQSTREFLTSELYLGKCMILFESKADKISVEDKYEASLKLLNTISKYIFDLKGAFEGTKEFNEVKVSNVIKDKKLNLTKIVEGGEGAPQSDMDLKNRDWFVFEENYGTSEEKAFVKYFSSNEKKLREQYDEIYLIRNERFSELAIYNFKDGGRFEPDFILILKYKNTDKFLQEQIYIEAKGEHLLERDKWKENFLLEIENNAIPTKIYVDDNDYKIIGLPFYNQETQNDILEKIIEK